MADFDFVYDSIPSPNRVNVRGNIEIFWRLDDGVSIREVAEQHCQDEVLVIQQVISVYRFVHDATGARYFTANLYDPLVINTFRFDRQESFQICTISCETEHDMAILRMLVPLAFTIHESAQIPKYFPPPYVMNP